MPNLKPGTLADKIYAIEQEIKQAKVDLSKTKEVKRLSKLDEKRKTLEAQCMEVLNENDLDSAGGKVGKIAISEQVIATVEESTGGWEAVYKYIYKHKAFHLLNKALKQESIKEVWAEGKKIPGVGKFHKKKLSVRKAS